jgi:hypothetical protein
MARFVGSGMRAVVAGGFVAALMVGGLALAAEPGQQAPKPKYTTEEVMKKAHKGDTALVKKVQSGRASKAEIAQLLEYYKSMAEQAPPKGDATSWKAKTHALVLATEALAKGDASGMTAFKSAVNCKACHELHRPMK